MYGYYCDEVAELEEMYEAHWDEPGYDWDADEEEEEVDYCPDGDDIPF